jgi:hypothetical protein
MDESFDEVDVSNIDEEVTKVGNNYSYYFPNNLLQGKICEICLDDAIYEDNALLCCEKCETIVHQSCYGVEEMSDKWFVVLFSTLLF